MLLRHDATELGRRPARQSLADPICRPSYSVHCWRAACKLLIRAHANDANDDSLLKCLSIKCSNPRRKGITRRRGLTNMENDSGNKTRWADWRTLSPFRSAHARTANRSKRSAYDGYGLTSAPHVRSSIHQRNTRAHMPIN